MEEMISKKALQPILGAQVRRLRTQAGWSQEHLALMVDVAPLTILRIENGQRTPDAALLFSLADAFGVSADDLRRFSEAAEEKFLIRA